MNGMRRGGRGMPPAKGRARHVGGPSLAERTRQQRNVDGELHQAVAIQNFNGVREAVNAGANPNALVDRDRGLNLLSWLIYWDAPQDLIQLVARHPQTNITAATGPDGATALHIAAAEGKADALRILLTVAPQFRNVRDHLGRTPLYVAIANEKRDTEMILVDEYGADVNIPDVDEVTPFAVALLGTNSTEPGAVPPADLALPLYFWDLVDLSRPSALPGDRQQRLSPVALASLARRGDIMNFLVSERRARVDLPDRLEGNTSLHWYFLSPFSEGYSPVVRADIELLLNNGADYRARNKSGQTPVALAHAQGAGAFLDLVEAIATVRGATEADRIWRIYNP